ncbi:hypothetical protein Tco_0918417, partial [Tanacetum coccineum]
PFNVEECDFLAMTDGEEEEELNGNYIFMAKIQEVATDTDVGPFYDTYALAEVQYSPDHEYNVFAHEQTHPEEP